MKRQFPTLALSVAMLCAMVPTVLAQNNASQPPSSAPASPPAAQAAPPTATGDTAPAPMPIMEAPLEPVPGFEPFVDDCMGCYACSCFPCLRNSYVQLEYLFWWRQGGTTPPLVTTSPPGTPQGQAGILGQPGTEVLIGGNRLLDSGRPGGRITFGKWLDPCQVNGVVVRYFALGEDNYNSRISSTDYSIIGRPFFNASTQLQDALLVTFPNFTAGDVNVNASSDISGGDVFARMNFHRDPCLRMDLVAGYQGSRIDESLRVSHVFTSLDTGGTIPVGTVLDSFDSFDTRNEFHGGSVGLIAEFQRGCVNWQVLAKVGLGTMSQTATINGQTTTTQPGQQPVVVDSGLLAQPSNIGEFKQSEFSAVPELGINGSWQLSDHLNLIAGYSLIYWTKVARPGDQIDFSVNPTQVPGPIVGETRPLFNFNTTSMWVQGFNVGLEGRF